MPRDEDLFDFGIHITSDQAISVYALNKKEHSADAAVILPTPALGSEYYVFAHREPPGDGTGFDLESELLIVATEDGTEVEVTTSVDSWGNFKKGVPRTITLNRGQTYQIKSEKDLSGTYIRTKGESAGACKNIAVFGGNKFTNLGGCGQFHDHLYEQMFPVDTWGKKFLFVPYETRRGGDMIKIIAAQDDTEIAISFQNTIKLNAGEVYTNKALERIRIISANKPISVAQFSRSQECDGIEDLHADPFMIVLSPLEQSIKSITFNAFEVEYISDYYLTLVAEIKNVKNIKLDDQDITNKFVPFGDVAFASLRIAQGNHTLIAPNGVIAYVYGYGDKESFGYSAGTSLDKIKAELILNDATIALIDEEGCVNSEIDFSFEVQNQSSRVTRYNIFDWHFGDGSVVTGENPIHTYTNPGTYDVTLIASNGEAGCGSSETFSKHVIIRNVDVELVVGPQSVCPEVEDVEYSVQGGEGNTYQWEISNGSSFTVDSPSGDKVLVDWGMTNPDAFLKVTPYNNLGCKGDAITYAVNINNVLEPAIPESNVIFASQACVNTAEGIIYYTPQTNGSIYEWYIDGGHFVNGSNVGNEVSVIWDRLGAGQVWYMESNPLIDDCAGVSAPLNVTIYPELKASPTITDISCSGRLDGSIELMISGGRPGTYDVIWDNGDTGLSISGLAAGDYEATITDAAGCQLVVSYTIVEPALLTIANSEILPVRCFQENNGSITLDILGGTPNAQGNYTLQVIGEHFNETFNTNMATNLPAGDFTITVTDSRGCQTSRQYTVAEPPALAPLLESFINEPICPQASDGMTFIEAKGGIPDYQFYWSNQPSVNTQEGTNFSKGTYNLRIVDANGCETMMDFDVVERLPKIFIPNAFSPNNDGVNDVFEPITDCDLAYSMQVFNRWGEIIFSKEGKGSGWDGSFKGEKVQDGQYSYVVFYAGLVNGVGFEETRRGSFKLFR
ncbi:hypothetical protein AWN68_15405 [Roseivirga echinicomitans]|uniref:PKD domain-containing protein n=2 Tax=Roseivirga echinicomitans TaxID=296218 RepID=A0A150XU09_9BACT|nr:hypothetical protein AWN68_15405 [Roseivirga echinicomitans]